jgi:hypothetical protein
MIANASLDVGAYPRYMGLHRRNEVIIINLAVETRSAKWGVFGGQRLEKMSERRNTKVD